jgi:eukaryotic-like serine/threonine-protein kinase
MQSTATGTFVRTATTAAPIALCVGDWALHDELGRGGMAVVYRARHPDGRRAAVKLLREDVPASAERTRAFMAEAATMQRVTHPGAVAVLEHGQAEDGRPYYVMERLSGVTLDQLLRTRGGRLPAQEALVLIEELLDVLAAYHDAGVIHRDIKPANLFVTSAGALKLLDFGVAKATGEVDDAAGTGSRVGTPAYMAPEQAVHASRGIDARSDLFAVGATLYRLVSGRRVRETDRGDEAFVLAATTRPRSVARVAPELPLSVIQLIDRALAWTPRDRFDDAPQMRERVRAILDANLVDGERTQARRAIRADLSARIEADEEFIDPQLRDRRRSALKALFRAMSGVFGTAMQYEWEHEQCLARRSAAWNALEAELAEGNVAWELSPFSFNGFGEVLWEPDAAQDSIPYHLFSSGFRAIRIRSDVSRDAFERLLRLMATDPVRDLAPEDDLATIFAEQRFEGIDVTLVNAFDIELLLEKMEIQTALATVRASVNAALADDLDEQAELAELAAEVGAGGIREAEVVALNFEQSVTNLLRPELSLPLAPKRLDALRDALDLADWEPRAEGVLAEALESVAALGDAALVTAPLVERLQGDEAARDALLLPLAARLSDTALAAALDALTDPEQWQYVWASADRALRAGSSDAPSWRRILEQAPRAVLAWRLEAYISSPTSEVGALLRGPLVRDLPGSERLVEAWLPTVSEATAGSLMAVLIDVGTDAALRALAKIAGHPSEAVRTRALTYTLARPSELVFGEVERLLRSTDPSTRGAVIEALQVHRPSGIAGRIVHLLREENAHQRPLLERQRMLTLLFELAPVDAEQLAATILRRHGFWASERRNASRLLATQLLGNYGRSVAALDAVRSCERRWWWNTAPLRDAARAAASAIEARIGLSPKDRP